VRTPCYHEVYRVTPLVLGKALNSHHFDFMALAADTLHELFSGPLGQVVTLAGKGGSGKQEAEVHAESAN